MSDRLKRITAITAEMQTANDSEQALRLSRELKRLTGEMVAEMTTVNKSREAARIESLRLALERVRVLMEGCRRCAPNDAYVSALLLGHFEMGAFGRVIEAVRACNFAVATARAFDSSIWPSDPAVTDLAVAMQQYDAVMKLRKYPQ